MSVTTRLFATAATALVTLGVGAVPALAGSRGPAATEALKLQPTIQQYIDSSGTAAQKRKTAAALLVNASKCDHAAQLVSRTHPRFTEGRDLWVKGVRLQAAGDRELATGLRLELAGQTAAGRQKINAATGHDGPLLRSDSEVSHADDRLGISRALGRVENG